MSLMEYITIGACAGIIDEVTVRRYAEGEGVGVYDMSEVQRLVKRMTRPLKDMDIRLLTMRIGVYLETISDVYKYDLDEHLIYYDFKNLKIDDC